MQYLNVGPLKEQKEEALRKLETLRDALYSVEIVSARPGSLPGIPQSHIE